MFCYTKNHLPIGIFDSGLGGLTVLKELTTLLPNESFLYFGDTARVPYGGKSPDTIKRYALEIAEYLFAKQIKLLVVACNTATAAALDSIREYLPIPVIGVIDPGVDAALNLGCSKIAVLGTKSTINSQIYQRKLSSRGSFSKVAAKSCPLFVPFIEEGIIKGNLLKNVIEHYLADLDDIDAVLLGCTHYPLLMKPLHEYFGKKVSLISSAETCAKQVLALLVSQELSNKAIKKGEVSFFVTDTPADFKSLGKIFLPTPIEKITLVSELFCEVSNA